MEWWKQNAVPIGVTLGGALLTVGGFLAGFRSIESDLIRVKSDLAGIQASLENHAVHIEGLEKRETETGLVLRELRDTTARANAYLVALCQATPTARCIYP